VEVKNMIIAKENIENYIPQRSPFVMISTLLVAETKHFETDFHITKGNIFLEDGILREYALIENIAQSCAAGLAYTRRNRENALSEGFIGGISKLKVYHLPKVNETIHTCVNLLYELGGLFLLKGECFAGDKRLIECELKLAGR
jgi:predicted hotdog family 3-hydroxylacyl-ACP dehydratase